MNKAVPPTIVKEEQKLNGRLAALSRFLSKYGDKCFIFFASLREAKRFSRDQECETTFRHLKEHLMALPSLAKLVVGETLSLYLVILSEMVSAVLVRCDSQKQLMIYFVNSLFLAAEKNYIEI